MDIFMVSYLETDEKEILNEEEELLSTVTHLCWERMNWTPLLAVHEGHIFIHSETWECDFVSQKGIKEWIDKGIDVINDSDYVFVEKLEVLLNIKIEKL